MPGLLPRLNPAQHRLFQRHVERAIEALQEADRLLKGAVGDVVARMAAALHVEAKAVEEAEARKVSFELARLPPALVPYVDDPFAQSLAFNLFCEVNTLSHTQGAKEWTGGAGAVAARNLMFLPAIFHELWREGHLDKTRLVAIANRNLKAEAYEEVASLVRTRRKEDVDERLLRMPPHLLQVGRRGPAEANKAAVDHGWKAKLAMVEIPEDLVKEAGAQAAPSQGPAAAAERTLRAGLGGAQLAPEVSEALARSPDPATLVERFLTAHKQAGDPDPQTVTKTLFFAHAGPMQRLEADDKLLLRHFRPVKTQKRGQLFYRLLEAMEERLQERSHAPVLDERGITEQDAMAAVKEVLVSLNRDPNRFLEVPEAWLGEVTRRHLYFGSRTRKEGAAYKWFRKIGMQFFLGGHKTQEELDEKAARRAAKAEAN